MKVERLPFDKDRYCNAKVGKQTQTYRTRINESNDCHLKARYKIDDKFYCDRHAGLMVLNIACQKGEI